MIPERNPPTRRPATEARVAGGLPGRGGCRRTRCTGGGRGLPADRARPRPRAQARHARSGSGSGRHGSSKRKDEDDGGERGDHELVVVLLHYLDRGALGGPQARHGPGGHDGGEDPVAETHVALTHRIRDRPVGLRVGLDDVVHVDVDQGPVQVFERQPFRQVAALRAVAQVVVAVMKRVDIARRAEAPDLRFGLRVDRAKRLALDERRSRAGERVARC